MVDQKTVRVYHYFKNDTSVPFCYSRLNMLLSMSVPRSVTGLRLAFNY